MRNLLCTAFVKGHDRRCRRLHDDDHGLSLVSFALGAAFLVVPMAVGLFLFGDQASDKAAEALRSLIDADTPSLP